MWNGLASFFYGISASDQVDKEAKDAVDQLTVRPTTDDHDWLLVEKPENASEKNALKDSLQDLLPRDTDSKIQQHHPHSAAEILSSTSVASPVGPSTPPAKASADHSRQCPARAVKCLSSPSSACPGRRRHDVISKATVTPPNGYSPRPLRNSAAVRANRVYEVQSRCKRPRRYNYVIRSDGACKNGANRC